MAVSIYTQDGIQHYLGLSTDVKLTPVDSGATFLELDTKKGWIYDNKNINPLTSNGWWGV